MKKFNLLFFLFLLIICAACRPESVAVENPVTGAAEESGSDVALQVTADQATAAVEAAATSTAIVTAIPTSSGDEGDRKATSTPLATIEATVTPAVDTEQQQESIDEDLPLLPAFQEGHTNGIGVPLPEGEEDPFAGAAFHFTGKFPDGPARAVVQEHAFGHIDEALALKLARQFGFDGPLYVQQIPEMYAPPEGEESSPVYTAFDGRRVMVINDTGLTLEDRGVIVDYNQRPPFATTAPLVETQLKEWGLLNFPYQIVDLDDTIVQVFRLIDGIPTSQNEFNMFYNHQGELNYFDYQPAREVTDLGNYPLQPAAMAWQQIQQPEGRVGIRYEIFPLQPFLEESIDGFTNPRSWVPISDPGQELHLYMTPAVYEAVDGSGLRMVYGDFTLAGDEDELAKIAANFEKVFHVWGTTGVEDGSKTLNVDGWEIVDLVAYETLEGTIVREDGLTLLQTDGGELFILPAVPADVEDGVEVYASTMAQRDIGVEYPVLDWNSLTEKIEWPDIPVPTAGPEPGPITGVTVDDVALIYYTIYQSVDSPDSQPAWLMLPVWRFNGSSDQDQRVTFWVPAVKPEYFSPPSS